MELDPDLLPLLAQCTQSHRRVFAAALEWEALRAALNLDAAATAQGVVTEIMNLRAQVAARGYALLDGEPVEYEVAYG